MRIANIRRIDITNGEGIRVSLFTQGCSLHCKGCFNYDIWDYNGGELWTEETKRMFLSLCDRPEIKGISILGGEPLSKENYEDLKDLLTTFKQEFPNKDIWLWTGYTVEELTPEQKDIVMLVDVLIDGRWVQELGDFNLKFRGSSNQRVIDVQKSLKENKIILKNVDF